MKRFILLFLILFAALLGAQAPPAPSVPPAPTGDQPEATIPQDSFDAGNVLKGKKVEHTFIIKNTGKAELNILSAKPG